MTRGLSWLCAAGLATALFSCTQNGGPSAVLEDVGGNSADVAGYQIAFPQGGTKVAWIDSAGVHVSLAQPDSTPSTVAASEPPQTAAAGASGAQAVFGCPMGVTPCPPLVVDTAAGSTSMLMAVPPKAPLAVAGGLLFAGDGAGGVSVQPLGGGKPVDVVLDAGATSQTLALVPAADGKTFAALVRQADGMDHVYLAGADGTNVQPIAATPFSASAPAAPLLAATLGATPRIAVVEGAHFLYDVVPAIMKANELYEAPGAITALAVTADGIISFAEQGTGGSPAQVREWLDSSKTPEIIAEMTDAPTQLLTSRTYLFWVENPSSGGQIWISTPATATARDLGEVGNGQTLSSLEADGTYVYALVTPYGGNGSRWIGRAWYGTL